MFSVLWVRSTLADLAQIRTDLGIGPASNETGDELLKQAAELKSSADSEESTPEASPATEPGTPAT